MWKFPGRSTENTRITLWPFSKVLLTNCIETSLSNQHFLGFAFACHKMKSSKKVTPKYTNQSERNWSLTSKSSAFAHFLYKFFISLMESWSWKVRWPKELQTSLKTYFIWALINFSQGGWRNSASSLVSSLISNFYIANSSEYTLSKPLPLG